jgi:cystathionine beta-lyase
MGGFHIATAIVPDADIRSAIKQRLYDFGHYCGRPTLFSIIAQTAAYTKGSPWLDELIKYLEGNFDLMLEEIRDLPLKANKPEGTYMFWVDCSALKLNTDQLSSLMLDKAGVLPELGHIFDSADYMNYKGMQTHFRLNAAMPRSIIKQAMEGIRKAVKTII